MCGGYPSGRREERAVRVDRGLTSRSSVARSPRLRAGRPGRRETRGAIPATATGLPMRCLMCSGGIPITAVECAGLSSRTRTEISSTGTDGPSALEPPLWRPRRARDSDEESYSVHVCPIGTACIALAMVSIAMTRFRAVVFPHLPTRRLEQCFLSGPPTRRRGVPARPGLFRGFLRSPHIHPPAPVRT